MKILLSLFFTACTMFAQATLSLVNPGPIPPAGYLPGATITLNIVKTGNASTTGLQFDVGTTAGSITAAVGPAVTTGSKIVQCSTVNPIRCLEIGLANTTVIPDGTVVVASLTLPASVSTSPVVVTLSNPVEADAGGNSLTVTVGNPTVSLSIKNACDVNGDGSVSSADSSAVVNQALTRTSTATTDLNGDGKTDVLDAQIAATAASPGGVCNAH